VSARLPGTRGLENITVEIREKEQIRQEAHQPIRQIRKPRVAKCRNTKVLQTSLKKYREYRVKNKPRIAGEKSEKKKKGPQIHDQKKSIKKRIRVVGYDKLGKRQVFVNAKVRRAYGEKCERGLSEMQNWGAKFRDQKGV